MIIFSAAINSQKCTRYLRSKMRLEMRFLVKYYNSLLFCFETGVDPDMTENSKGVVL